MLTLNKLLADIEDGISATEAISKYGFDEHTPFTYTDDSAHKCPYREFIIYSLPMVLSNGYRINVNEITICVNKNEKTASLQAVNLEGFEEEFYFKAA